MRKNKPENRILAFFRPRSAGSSASNGENTNLRLSDLIFRAGSVFTGVLVAVVVAYCLRDGEFHAEYSISRYMGREAWSAVVFALCNFVVVWCLGRYVREAWKAYGKVWLVLMIVVMACFAGLSLCPIGLFDETYGDYGVVSVLHQIFSRGMFAAMAATAGVMGWQRRKEGKIWLVYLGYVLYAVFYGTTNVLGVFWDVNFVIETTYIYGFYVILMIK